MRPDGLKKIYYSIREVSDATGVEPHVLRFWEKEFPMLRPRRGRSGNRTYRDRDIDLIQQIKGLLWTEKYTIQGACEALRRGRQTANPASEVDAGAQRSLSFSAQRNEVLDALRQDLQELKDLIASKSS